MGIFSVTHSKKYIGINYPDDCHYIYSGNEQHSQCSAFYT